MFRKSFLLLFGVYSVSFMSGCMNGFYDPFQTDLLTQDSCPKGFVDTPNTGIGDLVICCPLGSVGQDGVCVDEPASMEPEPQAQPASENIIAEPVEPQQSSTIQEQPIQDPINEKQAEASMPEKFIYLTAPESRGDAYCPARANSLAWNGSEFECCGKNMKAVIIHSRGDSICCPTASQEARWIGKKWNDYECCPAGTVETKNTGDGDKYLCCPKDNKALNGECLSLK